MVNLSLFFFFKSIVRVYCVPGCSKTCANVMSLLLMPLFCLQTSRDGVNWGLGEAVPRLPGETRITGKDPMKLGFV